MKSDEKKITDLIKEEVALFETKVSSHSLRRLNGRLDRMKTYNDITQSEYDIIMKNLTDVLSFDFKPKQSFGILLGTFVPNPKSTSYTNTNKFNPGVSFYEIYSDDPDDLMKDSTGDEFWGIVRQNVLTTVMLRKRLQRQYANREREDKGGLGVDVVINNMNDYREIQATEQALEKQKEQERLQRADDKINIDGVWWVIDKNKKIIFKKNKPETFITFDNFLDYPDWDDETKDEIYNRIF
ncbi:MAG: hypothetical protein WBC75_05665 [Dehalococcoidales bacterium]